MKYYAIKQVAVATDKNPYFKGETKVWFYGKKWNAIYFDSNNKVIFKEDLFTTKASACRALRAHKELNDFENKAGYWVSTSEIIEIED